MIINGHRVARVFPRRTAATPIDSLAFIGEPGFFPPVADEIRVSATFTWDRVEAGRLLAAWSSAWDGRFEGRVSLGGPAYDDPGGPFRPGLYLREGYVITSRGCPRQCDFCLVPGREGALRELPVTGGWDVLDNNLLACSERHLDEVFAMLRGQGRPIKFSGGFDPRLLTTAAIADRLRGVRIERVFTAYDETAERAAALSAVTRLRKAGLRRRQVGCYVLIGRDGDTFEAAEGRCREVWETGGEPFGMLYRPPDGAPPSIEWRRFQRKWCRPPAYGKEMRHMDAAEEARV